MFMNSKMNINTISSFRNWWWLMFLVDIMISNVKGSDACYLVPYMFNVLKHCLIWKLASSLLMRFIFIRKIWNSPFCLYWKILKMSHLLYHFASGYLATLSNCFLRKYRNDWGQYFIISCTLISWDTNIVRFFFFKFHQFYMF